MIDAFGWSTRHTCFRKMPSRTKTKDIPTSGLVTPPIKVVRNRGIQLRVTYDINILTYTNGLAV